MSMPTSEVPSASQSTDKDFTTVCAVFHLRQKSDQESAERDRQKEEVGVCREKRKQVCQRKKAAKFKDKMTARKTE